MNLNYRAITNILGGVLTTIAASFVFPIIVSIIYKEYTNVFSFLVVGIPLLIVGMILRKFVFIPSHILKIREGFFIVSLTWILFTCIGALPFVISGDIPHYVDALFETCSGFSTTGATILTDIESMSKGMLFWRSLTHWLGGVGILFLMVAVMPLLYSGKQNIALESTGPSLDKTSSKLSDTARQLYRLYFIFTVAEILLLMIGGMTPFDSIIHSFGSVSTGGFSSYNDSIAHFNSLYVEIVIMIFMLLCGISFTLYFFGFKRGFKSFIMDSELRLYLIIIILASALISLTLFLSGDGSVADSLFQTISIITTTGYTTADYDLWPQFARSIIFLLFFVGGCASSTAGGVKVFRILILLKLIRRSIGARLHPNAIISVKIRGRKISNDVVSNVTSFVFLYIVLIAVGSLLVSFDNYSIVTTLSAVISSLGNIGPGFDLVGPALNYSVFSDWSKCVLSFLMIAGRLELFTFLAFFMPHFWNPDRY